MKTAACALLAFMTTLATEVTIPGHAIADAESADKAFRKGKKFLQQKRYPEACAAFEESFREDPAIGAQLNVARCYEEWGKPATAYAAYREALALARATDDKRASQIKDLIENIDKEVPVLVLTLPSGRLAPPGLEVTIDGNDFDLARLGKGIRVDPGAHVVVMRTAESPPHTITVTAFSGKRVPVELPIDAVQNKPAPAEAPISQKNNRTKPSPDAEAEAEVVDETQDAAFAHIGRQRRRLGLYVGGGGVAVFAVATLVALKARGDYREAFDAHCDAATKQCDPEGLTGTRDARSQADLATVLGGVALAAIGTGAVLYFTAPRESSGSRQSNYLRPLLLRGGAGIAFGGAL